MNKLNLSIGVLLVGGLLVGCGSKSSGGAAGSTGTAGTGTAGSAGALYWTDTMNKAVYSTPTATPGTAKLISGAETLAPTAIAVSGTTVFWLDGKSIRKSVAGAAPVLVYTHADAINGIAVST